MTNQKDMRELNYLRVAQIFANSGQMSAAFYWQRKASAINNALQESQR